MNDSLLVLADLGTTDSRGVDRTSAVDAQVGSRVRDRRRQLGLNQQQFAAMIGLTAQQTNKYERGINRISAGRLFQIAEVLDTAITWFFEDLERAVVQGDPAVGRSSMDLARSFGGIDNEQHRKALIEMVRSLADQATRRKNQCH